MDRLELVKIVDKAKTLKMPVIVLYEDYIIGTDVNTYYLSVIKNDHKVSRPYAYISKDMLNFVKPLTLVDTISTDNNIMTSSLNTSVSIYNSILYRNTVRNFKQIQKLLYEHNVDKIVNNLEKDESFMNILNKKTKDGIELYKINRKWMLSIFKGLIPLNKGDKVNLNIYDIDEIKFLSNFEIDKKVKKADNIKINIYVMYRYI